MTIAETVAALALTVAHDAGGERLVTGAMVTDLLSEVLASGSPGQVWITIQTHRNVVAVASTQDLAAVIIAGGRQPQADVIALAREQAVTLLTSDQSAYTVAGALYALGVQ
jgi:predicted transcriptional regulator